MNETEQSTYVSPLKRIKAKHETKTVSSNIAWFKLAEFMQRGEKERAFNLYSLLQHSILDSAFLKKLKADIWYTFEKKKAEQLYQEAAHEYSNKGFFDQALLLYESLIIHYPQNIFYFEQAIQLTEKLGFYKKQKDLKKGFLLALLKNGSIEKSLSEFEKIKQESKEADLFIFYKEFVVQALKHKYMEQEEIKYALYKVLDFFLFSSMDKELQKFISYLQELNKLWYTLSCRYINQQK